ncbi:kinase suppressor of ras 1 isoform 1 [Lynx pardinus]|uniref:Kinase suppressor of ras 1 isoform 1 n=1 Tax=Lynx pardinus TaxID=191816 RepID=A0A485N2D4_LYNPA|nr:kinase suppressor of ras 1 isoform 1 [Lynx pardinus]
MVRRDIGLSVTHRFSTKSWLSQVCHVCQKSMMFGVKCKHCRLKCHNKCTKEAPACRISFLPQPRLRRTESVPSDINNPVDRAAEPHFGTLPKALTKKEHPPAMNHLDSSSNPSSTTSSTPSSPAPFPTSSNPSSATTPPNPSPGQRDSRFNFPAAYFIHHRQQFIFPDISAFPQAAPSPEAADSTRLDNQPKADVLEDREGEAEETEAGKSEAEDDEDEVDDLPSSGLSWLLCRGSFFLFPKRGLFTCPLLTPSSFKARRTLIMWEASSTWAVGRWPYVRLFLSWRDGHFSGGSCPRSGGHRGSMRDPEFRVRRHLDLGTVPRTSLNQASAMLLNCCVAWGGQPKVNPCHSSSRPADVRLAVFQGMGYLHAKGIVHKDLKSKNVFYDNGKVVITDFGLFGISGVVREGRRENQLKLSHDWLCYLAPEIVREMTPGKDEDQLPFSKAADVYAFGCKMGRIMHISGPLSTFQLLDSPPWLVAPALNSGGLTEKVKMSQERCEILSACWAFDLQERPSFTLLMDMLEKLPKLNRRLSHPGHFWKSAERWRSRYYGKGRYGHLDFKNSFPVLEEHINSSKVVPRFERFGLGVLEPSNPKM